MSNFKNLFGGDNNRVDIMIDFETLSLELDATILQLSAVVFDINTAKSKEEFNMFVDISKVEDKDKVIDSETIKFWMSSDQNKKVLHDIVSKGNAYEHIVLKSFYKFLEKFIKKHGVNNVYLWANGMLFDTALLEHKFKKLGLDNPIIYKNKLDLRSIVKFTVLVSRLEEKQLIGKAISRASAGKDKKSKNIHNALNDCYFQINLLKVCIDEIKKAS